MISTPSCRIAAVALACALLLVPASANASPETLKRSVGNILQAPLDIVLSPVVAGSALVQNLRDVDDTPGVRIAYTIPGYFWLTGVEIGAATIRGITGLIEFIPGLLLLPFEADMDPLMDPIERGPALVDYDTPVLHVKFGINYMVSD